MKIEANNGLVFDDTDSRCDFSIIHITAALTIAFVQCFDNTSGTVRRYCGVYNEYDKENSIKEIMLKGAKFDNTVKYWSERL